MKTLSHTGTYNECVDIVTKYKGARILDQIIYFGPNGQDFSVFLSYRSKETPEQIKERLNAFEKKNK